MDRKETNLTAIDMEQFGHFLAVQRKEQGMTQRMLADRVGVSDKAVSKWERGLSLPDTALLISLSEVLGVTVTELLLGKHLENAERISDSDAERLVQNAVQGRSVVVLSEEEKHELKKTKKKRALFYVAEILLVIIEMAVLYGLGVSRNDFLNDVLLLELLPLGFGIWFFFFIRERLPAYYDTEKISFYSDGIFRMNMAGMYFNNRNWPHILKCVRIWCGMVPITYPVFYLFLRFVVPAAVWNMVAVRLTVMLGISLGGLFIPIYVAGRKYQ